MSANRIWVVGAGGVGSVIAGKLVPEARCTLIDPWPEHVEAIRAHGLRIEYPDGEVRIAPQIYYETEIAEIPEQPDVVLLAVKTLRTEECLKLLAPHLSDDAIVVSLQNGLNEELIGELVGVERTIGAVVDYGAEVLAPGRVRGHALDGVLIGELDGKITPRLRALAALVDPAIPIRLTDNIWGALWSKLTINVEVNALCALAGLPTDQLAASRPLRRTAVALAMEAVAIASHLDLEVNPIFLDGDQETYLRGPGDSEAMEALERGFMNRWADDSSRPSMLQDVDKGRRTEIDALNGYIVEKGHALGIPAPTNEEIVRLVRALPVESGRPDRGAAVAELGKVYENLIR